MQKDRDSKERDRSKRMSKDDERSKRNSQGSMGSERHIQEKERSGSYRSSTDSRGDKGSRKAKGSSRRCYSRSGSRASSISSLDKVMVCRTKDYEETQKLMARGYSQEVHLIHTYTCLYTHIHAYTHLYMPIHAYTRIYSVTFNH